MVVWGIIEMESNCLLTFIIQKFELQLIRIIVTNCTPIQKTPGFDYCFPIGWKERPVVISNKNNLDINKIISTLKGNKVKGYNNGLIDQ